MVNFSVADNVLASRQLVSGGWSFGASQQASIEATCLAAFALADETLANAGASTQFLRQACLENADDGSQSHRGHECYHSVRNIPDCAVAPD